MNLQLDIFNQPEPVKEVLASGSPINEKKLAGDNGKVWNYLLEHGTIDMVRAEGIGVRNCFARINDLRKIHNKTIYARYFKIGKSTCKEYSITEFI